MRMCPKCKQVGEDTIVGEVSMMECPCGHNSGVSRELAENAEKLEAILAEIEI